MGNCHRSTALHWVRMPTRSPAAARPRGRARGIVSALALASVLSVLASTAGARPAGSEFQVNTFPNAFQANTTTVSNQDLPHVSAGSSGKFVVVWGGTQNDAFGDIFGQRFASMTVVSPCGNGGLDPGEDCDEGVANGSLTSCCTTFCT